MKKIDELFNELSEMIPEMKQNSKEWKAFLEEFINQKPDSKIDAAFKQELKRQIMERMNKNFVREASSDRISPWKTIFGFVGALAILSIVIIPNWKGQPTPPSSDESSMAQTEESGVAVSISNLDEEAFGDIEMTNEAAVSAASNPVPDVKMRAESGGGGDARSMIFPIGRTNFIYEYTGQPLDEVTEQSAVYRRKKKLDTSLGADLRPFLGKIGMSALDLTKFGDLELRQINLGQTAGKLPYMVNVDYYYGHISINPDYEIWQKVTCPSGICDYRPFKKEDMLSDTEIIRIARAFADQFDISLENTGEPEIQKYWEITPMLDAEGRTIDPESYPDTLTVIFPILIDQKEVKDGSGPMGIGIDVNMREKVVSGANIPLLSLESSSYDAQSTEAILSAAGQGGYDGIQYNNPDREIRLKIGTPTRELRRIWRQKADGVEELLMEMFVFPVNKEGTDSTPRDYYVPNEILVPVAKTL